MTVRLIGVPTDYGANRRGVDMGPSAIRYAGLAERVESVVACEDAGDLAATRPEETDPETDAFEGRARFLPAVRDVVSRLEERVAGALAEGATPLVLGGDHSIAIGSLRGTARDAEVGVVWFDAHGDFNTPETTPSGNVHGMSLAAALGVGAFGDADWAHTGIDPAHVALVGLRDLDPGERRALRDSDVAAYTMNDVDERGIAGVVEEALDVATRGTDGLHVSLDLDWLDPDEAPGVGTPVRGGATYREAHTAMEAVAETGALRSMDVVEVNPIMDEHNRTAELAAELVASAFGSRVL
ncbi:MAG: arginase [Haloarculaceae archaeon]